ncbi:MAG TPA: A/G-specific adenine glycosylase [Candidatus Krumholzibacteria bacterium]|nr:A/G-specific adenine glycosylase [Candidatus Krumholzibacteria bacterium]
MTRALLDWYAEAQRDLPWRHARDPYRIWVSEVMLQQTQVRTVIPYYERFLARFPDLASLAGAPLDEVLKLWEGLGYYARARNLHAAARAVVAEAGGTVPSQPDRFAELPGVGVYVCAAVMSIAFGRPLAAVDGNVKRVLARTFGVEDEVDRPTGASAIQAIADRLLDRDDPGGFNQAMMELGALVCRPRDPDCPACPWCDACVARAEDAPLDYPRKSARRSVPTARIAVGVVARRGRVLITRRAESAMLGGLWEFPGGKIRDRESAEAACRREIREETGLDVDVLAKVTTVRHAYSHLKVEIDVFRCVHRKGRVRLRGPVDHRWILLEETGSYAFPKANHKFIPVLKGEPAPGKRRRTAESAKRKRPSRRPARPGA